MNRAMLAAVAVLVAFALAGCGSSSNNVQNPAQNYAGLNPTVAVSPATANVQPGSKQQFVATVTNSVDDTVTWEEAESPVATRPWKHRHQRRLYRTGCGAHTLPKGNGDSAS